MSWTDAEIVAAMATHGSKRAAAVALGMTRSTFRRRLAQIAPDTVRPPNAPAEASAQRLGGSAEDREKVALRDEVARLRRELIDTHRVELDKDTVLGLIGRLADTPEAPPDWIITETTSEHTRRTPEVPVVAFADWHFGEVVSKSETNGVNEFNVEIGGARVRRLVEATINICMKHGPGRYPGIVVNLLGDFVSGGLHPELAKTDELEVLPSVLRVRDLLVWAINRLEEAFGRVYLPCVAGNHGRQTQKPEFKRYVYKNFDWLIYELLARHFEGREGIVFNIPDANEVHYRVFGLRLLAMHGDMLGVKGGDGIIGSLGPIARGEVKVGKQASAFGRDYDVLLIGHWHQQLWLPRVIVSNSLKGFDEYAKNALRAPPSEPSQPLFFVHPRRGITSRWDVKVDEPKAAGVEPWVSVFAEAA